MTSKQTTNIDVFVTTIAKNVFGMKFKKFEDSVMGTVYYSADHMIAISEEEWCKKYLLYAKIACEPRVDRYDAKVVFYKYDDGFDVAYRFNESNVNKKCAVAIEKIGYKAAYTFPKTTPVAFELNNGLWITIAPSFFLGDDVDIKNTPIEEIREKMHVPYKIVDLADYKKALRDLGAEKTNVRAVVDKLSSTRKTMF